MAKFICTGNIKHNKKPHVFGDSIELDKKDADPLLEANLVQTEKDFKRDQALRNYIPPDIRDLEDEIVKLNETIKLLRMENGRLKARASGGPTKTDGAPEAKITN